MTPRPVHAMPHVSDHAPATRGRRTRLALLLMMFVAGPCVAEPAELGRLFYTAPQRAQLEDARTRNVTRLGTGKPVAPAAIPAPAPRRFDGIVIRSDGTATRWVNGQPEVGPSSVPGLKPGQVRANGKVYEPYQILRPEPVEPKAKEMAR